MPHNSVTQSIIACPSSPLFDCLVRPDQMLYTDRGVLIGDQIYLVIPAPLQFPDVLRLILFEFVGVSYL
jgi:hypothetical protein